MHVKVTRPFKAVDPSRSTIHPRTVEAGEVVSGRLAEIALAMGRGEKADGSSAPPVDGGQGDTIDPQRTTPPRRAKLKRLHTEGEIRFAKGSIVEGDEADRLIAAGVAEELKDLAGPPETK